MYIKLKTMLFVFLHLHTPIHTHTNTHTHTHTFDNIYLIIACKIIMITKVHCDSFSLVPLLC